MAFYRRSYGVRRSGYGIGYRLPRGSRFGARGRYRGRARASRTATTIVIQAPQGSMRPRVRAGYSARRSWGRRY